MNVRRNLEKDLGRNIVGQRAPQQPAQAERENWRIEVIKELPKRLPDGSGGVN